MQHLSKDHGIKEPWVYHVARREIQPPSSFDSFHEFPRQKGWYIDHKDYTIHALGSPDRGSVEGWGLNLRSFLQAWLFFGLIFTVVQTDGHPLLQYEDLLHVDGNYVSTERLRDMLELWELWEEAHPEGQRVRMIRLEETLRLARRVVRRNLAWVGPPRTQTYSVLRDDPLYVDDEIILSIMTLGEALQDAKSKILKIMGMKLPGPDDDDDSGWGPPRYVVERMEKDMCPRTVHLLRGQFQSNATLLLSAWSTRSAPNIGLGDPVSPSRHEECTSSVCKVNPEDEPGGYKQRHCKGFCTNDDPRQPNSCGQYDNLSVIAETLDNLQQEKRPLLQFKDGSSGSPNSLALNVVSWKPTMEYATISHVWSDGFGNPKTNTMLSCQLRFIRHQLGKLRLGETAATSSTLSSPTLPFWIDTLLIPVGDDERTKKLKRRSIQQIPQLFRDSTHTIVLDFGLVTTEPSKGPAKTTMEIVASSWLRRLWTLQKASVSKNLYVDVQHDGLQKLKHFNDLGKELEDKEDSLTSTFISKVKKQLQIRVMDEEKIMRTGSLLETAQARPPREASVLVVNAWKTARWRVSCCPVSHIPARYPQLLRTCVIF